MAPKSPSPWRALAALVALALAPAPALAAGAEWLGVESSASGAVIVWSPQRLVRSAGDDEFEAVALGAGRILDVAVDDDGSFAVLLAGEADQPARVEFHPQGRPTLVVEATPDRIVAGGGGLVLLDEAGLRRLTWDGRPGPVIDVPTPCEGCVDRTSPDDLDLARDGTLRLTDTEINTCTSADILEWQRVVTARPGADRAHARTITVDPADYAATWRIGAHGWLYGVSYARRIVAVGARGAHPVTAIPTDGTWPDLQIAHNDRATVAAVGETLWRVEGHHARLLARAPTPPLDLALDPRSRPLVLLERDGEIRLLRFERARGWVTLHLPE